MRNLMRRMLIPVLAVTFTFLICGSQAGSQDDIKLSPIDVFKKIPGMQDKVKASMQKCAENMAKISMAIPIGDYETIEKSAQEINEKYNIEAGLTAEEYDAYFSMISPDFVLADQDLSQYTSALRSAAEGFFLEQTQLQYELSLRSCVNCHYTYAKEKFPKLAKSVVDF